MEICINLFTLHQSIYILHTWLFPFNIKRLVTLPNGRPNDMTSASVTSHGILRRWRTREGEQGGLSPLNFLLSFPLAKKHKICFLNYWNWFGWHATLTTMSHLIFRVSHLKHSKLRTVFNGEEEGKWETKATTFWMKFFFELLICKKLSPD